MLPKPVFVVCWPKPRSAKIRVRSFGRICRWAVQPWCVDVGWPAHRTCAQSMEGLGKLTTCVVAARSKPTECAALLLLLLRLRLLLLLVVGAEARSEAATTERHVHWLDALKA